MEKNITIKYDLDGDIILSDADMIKLVTAFYVSKKVTDNISNFFYNDFTKKLIKIYGE